MTAFLSSVTSVVTASMDWLQLTLNTILADYALTTMCVALPLVSRVVGLLARLIR